MRALLATLAALDGRGCVLRSRWGLVVPVSAVQVKWFGFVSWGAAGVGLACVMVLVKHALPGGLPARMVTSGANGWIHAWR